MKTAKDFLLEYGDGYIAGDYTPKEVCNIMIEFAKLHVESVVESIKNNVDYGIYQNDDGQEPFHHESNIFVDHRTIDSAYSIEDIK